MQALCTSGTHYFLSSDRGATRAWYTRAGVLVTDAAKVAELNAAYDAELNCPNVIAKLPCDTVTYLNTNDVTELTVSVAGGLDSIKLGLAAGTPASDNVSANRLAAHITDCLQAGKSVKLEWTTAAGGSGQGTISQQVTGFPNFFGRGDFTFTNSGQVGPITRMSASCDSEEDAYRTFDPCVLQAIKENTAAINAERVIHVVESCDGETMYGITNLGNTAWTRPNPSGGA